MTVRHTDDSCVIPHRAGHQPRAVDGLYACPACLQRLDSQLRALPSRWDQLGRALSPGSSPGQRVSGSPTTPLPINPAVADLRARIRAVLVSWTMLVCEDRGLTGPANGDVLNTATFLFEHVAWAAGHRWIDEFAAEITELTGRTRGLLEPTGNRALETGERCRVATDESDRCAGVITMAIRDDETWTARCSECGPQEPEPYMRDHLAGRWVTVQRVQLYALRTHAVRVTDTTVRSWALRGRITSKAEDGLTWYDLGSVEKYLASRPVRKAETVPSERERMSA